MDLQPLPIQEGLAPITYLWDDPGSQTTATASGLTAGTYHIVITDATGCQDIDSVTLTEPIAIVTSIVGDSATCFGCTDGSADLTVAGGTPAYSFLWSNGETTEDISGIPAGTYVVRVTDAVGCIKYDTVVIYEPNPFLFYIDSVRQVTCPGGNDGAIYTHATGGTREYSFSIDGGFSWVSDSIFTNLSANTYTIIVRDFHMYTRSDVAVMTDDDLVPPVAVCQDITVQLDATGNVTITGADVDNGSSDDPAGLASL